MTVKIIECPRDAMQGINQFIDTRIKATYINQLLQVGYDTIDFGSFVSPKSIPQMRDTAEVLNMLHLDYTSSKLLAIVANTRGAEDACRFSEINYIGFPFSISETFQQRNTGKTIIDSFHSVEEIQTLCARNNKELVVYISMGFGNPYGDNWNEQVIENWVHKISQTGVKIISMSDTIGIANPDTISYVFRNLVPEYPEIEFGAHFHTKPDAWREKIHAAFENGCKRFDGAIRGFGGCPMAEDTLTGNMPTENIVAYFDEINVETGIKKEAFFDAMHASTEVFGSHLLH